MEGSKRDTKSIGDRSELEVILALVRAGYLVSVPFGENHRYDLIAEKDNVLSRIQVKTGRLRDGVILFKCYSTHSHRGGPSRRLYTGEIEYFAIYCRETDGVYMIAVNGSEPKGALRAKPTRNRQAKRIHWAEDYLLEGSHDESRDCPAQRSMLGDAEGAAPS